MHHALHGRSDPAAPTLLLSSGLGGAGHYWTPQLPALARDFRVVTYDQSGTGGSPATLADGYAIADMAAEVAALLDGLGIGKCHFMGHALGGLVGLQLALDRPDLIDRLVVVNAWAKTHPHTMRCFAARTSLLLNDGPAAYVTAQPLFLYPAWWLADRQDWLREQDATALAHFPPVGNVLRRIGAILTYDLTARIPEIAAPTLVVATRDDILVPSTCSMTLAEMLQDAELTLLDQGGHACNITDPDGFDRLVGGFLTAK